MWNSAVEADPTTPHVAWEAANFFLVQGDRERALRHFRVVLANDPEMVDPALQLCWRATGDANQILDQALPRRPDLYLSFLRLLVSKQEVAAAENVWGHLIGLQQTFPTKLAFPYFRLLIAKQEVAAAQAAWQQLASVNPSLQAYLPSRENLIVNGGFEENVLNGGFDWWDEANPHCYPRHRYECVSRWQPIAFRHLRWAKYPGSRNHSVHPGQAKHRIRIQRRMQKRRIGYCQWPAFRDRGRIHQCSVRPHRRLARQQSVAAAGSTIPDRPGYEASPVENRPSACGPLDPWKALDRRSAARGEMRIGEVENSIVCDPRRGWFSNLETSA